MSDAFLSNITIQLAIFGGSLFQLLEFSLRFVGSFRASPSGVMKQFSLLFLPTLVLAAGCSSEAVWPHGAGTDQVILPLGFGIDRTEVTQEQYAHWLATSPDPAAQSDVCQWNADFAPDARCMTSSDEHLCKGPDCGDHPQVCVDWCDARAYCEAQGKRLCGRIGGGANAFERMADPEASQWFAACSAAGTADYPFENEASCNTIERGARHHYASWLADGMSPQP